MAKQRRLTELIEDAAKDPAVQALAASTAVASGAIAGKLAHDRVERAQRKRKRRYRLARQAPAGPEVRRVLTGQLDRAIERLSERRSSPGSAVHDARRALKQSRAALRLSRDLIGAKHFRRENRALRDAGRELSDARDAEVLIHTLDGLGAPGEFAALREALAVRQPVADRTLPANGQGVIDTESSVVGQLRQARGRIIELSVPATGGPVILAPGLKRIYRNGRRALSQARKHPSEENLHELRKRAKDLWHAAQLLEDRCGEPARKISRRAHRLSDLLGQEHDLAVLRQRLRRDPELLGAGERELLETLIADRRRALRRQALERAERLYRHKPGRLGARLGLT